VTLPFPSAAVTVRTALLLAAAAALAACASEESMSSAGRLDLPPGGRAEARTTVPLGSEAKIRVANRGPGRVNFVLRKEGGAEIASGELTTYTTELEKSDRHIEYVLVVESKSDQHARIEGYIQVMGREAETEVSWTQTQ
jgi:hypothetical protein